MIPLKSLRIENLNLRTGDSLNPMAMSFFITGLFAGDRTVIMNDLYTPGQSYHRGKTQPKRLILEGHTPFGDPRIIFELRSILFKDGLKRMIFQISGMPEMYMDIDLENMGTVRHMPEMISCQLVAPDPHMYASEAQEIKLGLEESAQALKYPITYPITYGIPSGASGSVNNRGNTDAYPVVTIEGTCSDIEVINKTTGESMSLDMALGPGDVLVIDNRPRTRSITVNGENRIDLKNGDWIRCIPGQNEFTFLRSSLESKQHCTISLRSVWI